MNRSRLLSSGRGRALLLGERAGREVRVEPIELFFDLVYVFAITRLTHRLLIDVSPRSIAETLLLLMAVWPVWSSTAWMSSRFDPRALPIRRLLIAIMLGSLFMSAAIPDAFGGEGFAFAAAYVAIQVGRNLMVLFAIGRGHPLTTQMVRVLIWSVALGGLWTAGGLLTGDQRLLVWTLAVAIEFIVTGLGWPVPGLDRSLGGPSSISGVHLAERNELFIIVALGESILVTGATYSGLPRSPAAVAALLVAFAISVQLWWIYFDRGAAAGREAIAHTQDLGRLGLVAYTYFHLPMVAGIILSAGANELIIAHPLDVPDGALTTVILGGPVLYLLGNALFIWALSNRVPRSRLVGIAALIALTPVAAAPALVLSLCAALVLLAIALWELRAGRRPEQPAEQSET